MSKYAAPVAKHRALPTRPQVARAPRRAIGTAVLLSSIAVAATGTVITGALMAGSADSAAGSTTSNAAATVDLASLSSANVTQREPQVSRSSDRRADTDPLKAAALAEPDGPSDSGSEDLSDADPREIAKALLGEFGFGLDQFGCLDSLYIRESNWNVYADNPSSSAYGIPQALPGSKMSSAGADWATNPVTQIRWGLGYIQDRYGSPCSALSFSDSRGYY